MVGVWCAKRSRWFGRMGLGLTAGVLCGLISGCSLDGLLKTDEVPAGTADPALTKTPQGALAIYQGLLAQFRTALGGGSGTYTSFVGTSGVLADELRAGDDFGGNSGRLNLYDLRSLPEQNANVPTNVYTELQTVRAQAAQAIGLLKLYVPDQPDLIGHSYALQAYAELMLAEQYCSGIPLSTVDFDGDYTLRPGSSTNDVLSHAVALFDTALAFTQDSTRFVQLAAAGKARAQLGLGQYAAAAATAASVLDDYRYEVAYSSSTNSAYNFVNYSAPGRGGLWAFSVADHEGDNGLDYVSSGDPRSASHLQGTNQYGFQVYTPNKYVGAGTSSIVLASGIEARLIEAEAALQAGEAATWLAKLNALRTDGTYDVTATTPPDTLWHAGTGGVAGLAPLADPGTADGRVDLLFRERAFWLFLTGHRQGDLRRLIRQYGRSQDQVFPVGAYPEAGVPDAMYGHDVTVPVPSSERQLNPQYTGCFSRSS